MKKSLALILALIMVLCMLPTVAFAKPSQASLTVNVKGEFYNPNTDKHQQFDNLKTTIHVTVNEGEHPSYPVKYYFTKQTYYGSTSSSYYGKEGYKLIVTIGDKESTDLKAWVFDRDMTNVKGDGQTFKPIYSPSGYGTYENTLSISGGTPIQPETGTLTIKKTVTGLPNDKLPASFTFKVMQGNNVKETVTVNKNGNNGYNAGSATLPHGTYTVVEVSATVDGYTVVTTPSNGEVTISGQPTNITFTNAYTKNEPQPETPPAQPDPRPSATPTIDGLTGVQVVEVKCITENSGHAKQAYQLIEGSYAVGEVQGDKESGYTCDITVEPEKYVKAYNTEYSGHTLETEGQIGTIKLVWDKDNQKWQLANPSGVLVVFKVVCAPVVDPSKPEKPSDDAVEALLGGVVTIDCTNNKVTHEDKTYGLLTGGFSVGDVEGNKETGYTCDITVNPDKYVEAYNTDIGVNHTLAPVVQTGTIKLSCNGTDKKWELANPSGVPVVFTVKCENQMPEKPNPPEPENTSKPFIELTGEEAVKVKCTTAGATHAEKSYGLKHDGYTIGEVKGDAESGYTCDITVNPDKYVEAYNEEIGVNHTLDPESQTHTITLKWKPDFSGDKIGEWVVASDIPVVFTVKCEDVKTYTVTYKDGVGGTAFKDQVHTGLKRGDATPGFTGTPYRWNYTFTGWKPAVAPTVSGNAVYTAQWSYNGGGWTPSYPINPVPPVVVVPPKTGDMPFWYSIAQFLGLVK